MLQVNLRNYQVNKEATNGDINLIKLIIKLIIYFTIILTWHEKLL